MNRNEKILLLQLILEDIRGDWGDNLTPRVNKALQLAKELDLKDHIEHIEDFIDHIYYDLTDDGRHFRTSYKNGGYIEMEELHGLDRILGDKSDEFKNSVSSILNNPEMRFD